MTDLPTLVARRQQAAVASGGTSNDAIYDAIVTYIQAHDLRGRVLDFGAGQGRLAQRLAGLGRFPTVVAVDIMDRPPSLAPSIGWVQADLNEPLSLRDNDFDVVVGAEVIEHLENPRAVARDWYRLLRPGGTIMLTTPNNESWRSLGALLARGHFAAFGDSSYPAHLTALLRKDLTRVLTEAGFRSPIFGYTALGMIPRTRLTWQAISRGRLRGVRYSDNVLAAARKPSQGGEA